MRCHVLLFSFWLPQSAYIFLWALFAQVGIHHSGWYRCKVVVNSLARETERENSVVFLLQVGVLGLLVLVYLFLLEHLGAYKKRDVSYLAG
ncbi:hypothetical protein B0H66DRAFT_347106 [Apodospora peruviana]|uniref:Uncharacterized protein n=1 Tax=Apodospora peruviana TaxID=516989 RepID=A0AAE0HZ67_9PEZI|nr:hypothetical protein B0H66DRAFT_347106 [Apodospora peruviana]